MTRGMNSLLTTEVFMFDRAKFEAVLLKKENRIMAKVHRRGARKTCEENIEETGKKLSALEETRANVKNSFEALKEKEKRDADEEIQLANLTEEVKKLDTDVKEAKSSLENFLKQREALKPKPQNPPKSNIKRMRRRAKQRRSFEDRLKLYDSTRPKEA